MNKPLNTAGFAVCLLLAVTAAGCLGPREVVGPRNYVIGPRISVEKSSTRLAATLGVRGFTAPQQYDRRMVVLEPDFRLVARANDTWAEPPASALTRCVTDALVASAHFADVGDAFDMARPDMVLTGELRAFHENKTVTPAVAEVEARLELREARSPRVLWAGTLHETEPLAGGEPGDFAVAINACVARLAEKAAESLAGVEYTVPDSDGGSDKAKK